MDSDSRPIWGTLAQQGMAVSIIETGASDRGSSMNAPAKRVVVGVDGSIESIEAIQWATEYAASTGAVDRG